ncbi:hypothetical protein [Wenyingzhuangia sp. IMCC45467]
MNRINIQCFYLLFAVLLMACSKEEVETTMVDPHVRFHFLVSSNNQPLEYPQVSSGLIAQSSHTHQSLVTLKIPVALSANQLKEKVTVSYEVYTENELNLVTMTPENQLTFQADKLVDTLYVNFNQRWETPQDISIKLTAVSDETIQIGALNDAYKNDEFSLTLESVNTTYALAQNRIEIQGQQGEQVQFDVQFPNGFVTDEIDELQMFTELKGFDYRLEKISENPFKKSITYQLTLNEAIDNDEVYYKSTVGLQSTDLYATSGNTILEIIKPTKTDRDVLLNTAANFYNLSDPFHRTYGENWMDSNNDGVCSWQSFFAFTYPVVVDADDENAVLYDDLGTDDPSDDIYHHAFRIGFNTTTSATATTNSFNLKRWFTGESGSAQYSPGFNIQEALEFFPTEGTNAKSGKVLVIPQNITIGTSAGKSYNIAISGEGTYEEISEDVFQLDFELNATNQELFGGTVTSVYKIYNTSNYQDPEDLTTNNCHATYDL